MKLLKIFLLMINIICFSSAFCVEAADVSSSSSVFAQALANRSAFAETSASSSGFAKASPNMSGFTKAYASSSSSLSSSSNGSSSSMLLFTSEKLKHLFFDGGDSPIESPSWKKYLNEVEQAIKCLGSNINTISINTNFEDLSPLQTLITAPVFDLDSESEAKHLEILRLLLNSPDINVDIELPYDGVSYGKHKAGRFELSIFSLLYVLFLREKFDIFGKHFPEALKLLLNKGANLEKFFNELNLYNDINLIEIYQRPEIQDIFKQYGEYKKYIKTKQITEAEKVLSKFIYVKGIVNLVTQYNRLTFLEYLQMMENSKISNSSNTSSSSSSSTSNGEK